MFTNAISFNLTEPMFFGSPVKQQYSITRETKTSEETLSYHRLLIQILGDVFNDIDKNPNQKLAQGYFDYLEQDLKTAYLNDLVNTLLSLPHAQTQAQFNDHYRRIKKQAAKFSKAACTWQMHEIQQAQWYLEQGCKFMRDAMQTNRLPKKRDRPLKFIIQQTYEHIYRAFGIDAPLPTIRKIVGIIAQSIELDYSDSQINTHLSPANRKAIRQRVDEQNQSNH